MHNNDRLVRCHHYSGTPRPRAAPSPSHSWYDPAYLNLSPQHFPWNTIKYLQFWQISRRIFLSAWAALQILLNILSPVPGIFAKSAASSGKAAGKPAGLAKLSNISPVYLLPVALHNGGETFHHGTSITLLYIWSLEFCSAVWLRIIKLICHDQVLLLPILNRQGWNTEYIAH